MNNRSTFSELFELVKNNERLTCECCRPDRRRESPISPQPPPKISNSQGPSVTEVPGDYSLKCYSEFSRRRDPREEIEAKYVPWTQNDPNTIWPVTDAPSHISIKDNLCADPWENTRSLKISNDSESHEECQYSFIRLDARLTGSRGTLLFLACDEERRKSDTGLVKLQRRDMDSSQCTNR